MQNRTQEIKKILADAGFPSSSVGFKWSFNTYLYTVYVQIGSSKRLTFVASGDESEVMPKIRQWIESERVHRECNAQLSLFA